VSNVNQVESAKRLGHGIVAIVTKANTTLSKKIFVKNVQVDGMETRKDRTHAECATVGKLLRKLGKLPVSHARKVNTRMAKPFVRAARPVFIKIPTEAVSASYAVTGITLRKGRKHKAFVLLDSLVVIRTRENDTNAMNVNEASMATNWVSPINTAASCVGRVYTVTCLR